jgi:hypothetical protein
VSTTILQQATRSNLKFSFRVLETGYRPNQRILIRERVAELRLRDYIPASQTIAVGFVLIGLARSSQLLLLIIAATWVPASFHRTPRGGCVSIVSTAHALDERPIRCGGFLKSIETP